MNIASARCLEIDLLADGKRQRWEIYGNTVSHLMSDSATFACIHEVGGYKAPNRPLFIFAWQG
jgi:hypothetical protein